MAVDKELEPESRRVQQVISRAETLVEQLDETVGDLVELLRGYATKENSNAH